MEDITRLFLKIDGCQAKVKQDDLPLNCHRLEEGEDYYHRIYPREVYLQHDQLSYCLSCALKLGYLSEEKPQLLSRPAVELSPRTDDTYKMAD